MKLNERFRGYLPVVVDLETGGFDKDVNPVLEVACSIPDWEDERLSVGEVHSWHVEPYEGSVIDPASLRVTGIDLDDPARDAVDEKTALGDFFRIVLRVVCFLIIKVNARTAACLTQHCMTISHSRQGGRIQTAERMKRISFNPRALARRVQKPLIK